VLISTEGVPGLSEFSWKGEQHKGASGDNVEKRIWSETQNMWKTVKGNTLALVDALRVSACKVISENGKAYECPEEFVGGVRLEEPRSECAAADAWSGRRCFRFRPRARLEPSAARGHAPGRRSTVAVTPPRRPGCACGPCTSSLCPRILLQPGTETFSRGHPWTSKETSAGVGATAGGSPWVLAVRSRPSRNRGPSANRRLSSNGWPAGPARVAPPRLTRLFPTVQWFP